MLKLDPNREAVAPVDAATLLVLRPGDDGPEVFCVRRHAKSAFMGGVVVFPGGKLDAADVELAALSDGIHERAGIFANDHAHARALAACACREALEEGAILPSTPPPDAAAALALRRELATGASLTQLLRRDGRLLCTSKLVPFARWVTPVAEARRFDARFFMTALPAGQVGVHDDHETTSSVWATARQMLDAFTRGDLFLAPPTIRALEILEPEADLEAALATCAAQSLGAICPELVALEPPTLALPGDPAHSIAERRVAGPTRFVLRDARFVSEDP